MGVLARATVGAAAGFAATGVMSLLMLGARRAEVLPEHPPRDIVEKVADFDSEGQAEATAAALHFAFGAGSGAAYSVLTPRALRGPLTGAAYGLLIWAVSYEGWVPAMGILPPAHRDSRGRVATMVLAHLAYGATLGSLSRR